MGDLPQDYNQLKRELELAKQALRDTSEQLGNVELLYWRERSHSIEVEAKRIFWKQVAITVIVLAAIETFLSAFGVI